MLAGSVKLDLWPTFHGQLQVHPRWSKVGQAAGRIQGEVVTGFLAKFSQFSFIFAGYPARSLDIDLFKATIHSVLIFKAKCHDIELQYPTRQQSGHCYSGV